jgi:hypothetical protein
LFFLLSFSPSIHPSFPLTHTVVLSWSERFKSSVLLHIPTVCNETSWCSNQYATFIL